MTDIGLMRRGTVVERDGVLARYYILVSDECADKVPDDAHGGDGAEIMQIGFRDQLDQTCADDGGVGCDRMDDFDSCVVVQPTGSGRADSGHDGGIEDIEIDSEETTAASWEMLQDGVNTFTHDGSGMDNMCAIIQR